MNRLYGPASVLRQRPADGCARGCPGSPKARDQRLGDAAVASGRDWLRPGHPILLQAIGMVLVALSGCTGEMARPLPELDRALEQAGSSRAPSLGDTVVAVISGRGGREQVLLVDAGSRLPIPLPGLNRPDAQPLSVSTDARGERLALVRHRQGRTEVVLYRRPLASVEPIPLQPDGVPRRVSLDPEGRTLAVEVSRNGLWQLDLITLP